MAVYTSLESRQHSPYGAGTPYLQSESGFVAPAPEPKKRTSNWIKFGIPVALILIAAAVVGGVLGRRASKSSSGGGGGNQDPAAAASSVASVKSAVGRYATGTNSKYMIPVYPSTVNSFFFGVYSYR
jgi:hypothetical protein